MGCSAASLQVPPLTASDPATATRGSTVGPRRTPHPAAHRADANPPARTGTPPGQSTFACNFAGKQGAPCTRLAAPDMEEPVPAPVCPCRESPQHAPPTPPPKKEDRESRRRRVRWCCGSSAACTRAPGGMHPYIGRVESPLGRSGVSVPSEEDSRPSPVRQGPGRGRPTRSGTRSGGRNGVHPAGARREWPATRSGPSQSSKSLALNSYADAYSPSRFAIIRP